MQIIKERYKSDLHNILEILTKRMTLEDEYRKILINFEKGYEGELHFDNLLKRFYSGEGIVLNDLKISYRGSSTQIELFLSQLSSQSRHIKQSHQFLADKLLNYSLRELPHQKEHPNYNWDHLKKGLSCKGCGSLNPPRTQRRITCIKCQKQESVSAALIRTIDELTLLFPNEKLTTPFVYEWVNASISKDRIGSFLKANFVMKGVSRAIYYEKLSSTENKPARVTT